jgi:hypothetical protein
MSFNTDVREPKLPSYGIEKYTVATAEEATPVPVLFGERLIPVRWISRAYNVKRTSHSRLKKEYFPATAITLLNEGLIRLFGLNDAPDVHDYRGSLAGLVCRGPVDEVLAVIVNGGLAWPRPHKDSQGYREWRTGVNYASGRIKMYQGFAYECLLTHTSDNTKKPGENATYWRLYSIKRSDMVDPDVPYEISIQYFGFIDFYWGTEGQAGAAILQSGGNNKAEQHPDYKGLCYVMLKNFRFGAEKKTAPNVQVLVRKAGTQGIITGDAAGLQGGQSNVIANLCDVLENELDVDASRIDTTTAQDTADDLDAQHALTAVSTLIDSQTTLRALTQQFREVSDCFMRYNPVTDEIEFGLYPHGAAPSSYTTLTADDLAQPPRFKCEGWREAKNRVVVRYDDRTRAFKSTSLKVDDMRSHFVLGEYRAMNLDRSVITRREQALAHGSETLRSLGGPQMTGTVVVRREKARDIRPGDYILLDIDWQPGGSALYQYFRVTRRAIPRYGPITLTIEAEENLTPIPVFAREDPPASDTDDVPEIAYARVFPVPPKLATAPDQYCIVAERPGDLVQAFRAYFDTDSAGDFQALGSTAVFAQRATLRSDHNDSTTTIETVVPSQVDSELFSEQPGQIAANDDYLLAILVEKDGDQIALDADGYAQVEVCSVISTSVVSAGNIDLEVMRGRQGTQSRAFTDENCEVWLILKSDLFAVTHQDFKTLRENAATGATPDTGYFRLQPIAQAERDLADCDNIEFEFPAKTQAGPTLTLSSPSGTSVNVTAPYPALVQVTGTAEDQDSNLIAYRVSVRKSTDTDETVVEENVFAPALSRDIDVPVYVGEQGTFYIKVRAWDTAGLVVESVITVTAAAGSNKVATPEFYFQGLRIPGDSMFRFGGCGPFELRCATGGATIEWTYAGPTAVYTPWTTYDPSNPATWPNLPSDDVPSNLYDRVQARATKSGMTTSNVSKLVND